MSATIEVTHCDDHWAYFNAKECPACASDRAYHWTVFLGIAGDPPSAYVEELDVVTYGNSPTRARKIAVAAAAQDYSDDIEVRRVARAF